MHLLSFVIYRIFANNEFVPAQTPASGALGATQFAQTAISALANFWRRYTRALTN